ncbi:MAG TPA: HPP family protein [Candidatus Baltobacteraceae bacterium]|jgi:CBS-domain-containing membrane protein
MRFDFGVLGGFKRRAFYVLLWSFVTMLLIGLVADLTQRPYIFPSLGPTALMVFAHPMRRDSAPRHVILGHAAGALCGYIALWLTGLLGVGFSSEIGGRRVLAAAIALGLTSALMVLLKSEHAPAGATTLIVALGILPRLVDFLFLMGAVVLLAVLALIINRICAIDYPIWSAAPWVRSHDAELLRKINTQRAKRR